MPDEHGKWTLEEYFKHFPDTKHAMGPLVDENARLRAALTNLADSIEELSEADFADDFIPLIEARSALAGGGDDWVE